MKKEARKGKRKVVIREDELRAMVAELVAQQLRDAAGGPRDVPRREAGDDGYGVEWCAC